MNILSKLVLLSYVIFVLALVALVPAANAVDNQQLIKCKSMQTGAVFVVSGSQCPRGSYFIGYA